MDTTTNTHTTDTRPLAYSYRRFSSVKQEEGDSLRRQKDIAKECAKEHNLHLVDNDEYSFLDRAKSAYSGANFNDDDSQLRRFYELVKSGAIPKGSYLIVESLDRLSRRHPTEALPRFFELLRAGVNVITGMDKRVYTGEPSEVELIVSIMEMSRSYRESKYKSERVGEAWRDKQELAREKLTPMGATRPAWLTPVYRDVDQGNPKKKPTHYVIDEDKAAIVRQIFQWTLDGYGREVIARKLNEAGVPAFRTEKGWGGSSVAQILKSPTVLGIYQPYRGKGKERVAVGEPIKGLYDPIIDEQTFYEAQRATDRRFRERVTKHPPRYNVWQKILKCTNCHASLNYYTKGAKQPPSLRCYEAGKGKCKARAIRVDRSEAAFKEMLTKVNSLALVQSDARSIQSRLYEVQGRIAEQQGLIAESQKLLLTRRSPTILSMIADADDEIAALQRQEVELEQALAADAITNKEDFLARVDLTSYEGRARANELLKRLGILVTAFKVDDTVRYEVYKKELKIFTMTDSGSDVPIQVKSYNGEVSTAMWKQGDTDELVAHGTFFRKLRKPEDAPKAAQPTGPVPDWSQYDDTLPDEAYELLGITGDEDEPVFHETPMHAPDD
ncbi:recombinase family protein [Massilia sp. IC2-476]|uniref:recombinase family protein n=1 Tax=Massilia sp. IC2-476 TaxID=2887199 RepID=UPI001D1028D3|nr:recombinase family protein [Massilia sp. IC2-476]MCC2971068.1 recombinase family protein [Massilia sp. IC2-476]